MKILLPQDVVLPTIYLNDLRFGLRRNKDGVIFITDSSQNGPSGIIVLDIASGESWRRLNDHYSSSQTPKITERTFARSEVLTVYQNGLGNSPRVTLKLRVTPLCIVVNTTLSPTDLLCI